MNFVNNNQPDKVPIDKVLNEWIVATGNGLLRGKDNDRLAIGVVGRVVKKTL